MRIKGRRRTVTTSYLTQVALSSWEMRISKAAFPTSTQDGKIPHKFEILYTFMESNCGYVPCHIYIHFLKWGFFYFIIHGDSL